MLEKGKVVNSGQVECWDFLRHVETFCDFIVNEVAIVLNKFFFIIWKYIMKLRKKLISEINEINKGI